MAKLLNVSVLAITTLFSLSITAMQEDTRLVKLIKRAGTACVIDYGKAMAQSDTIFPGQAGSKHILMASDRNRINIEVWAPSDKCDGEIHHQLEVKYNWVLELKHGLGVELTLSQDGIVREKRIVALREVLHLLIDRDGTAKFMKNSDEL